MTVVQDYTVVCLAILVGTALYHATYGAIAKGTPTRGAAAAVLLGACGLIGILAQYGDPGVPTVAN